MAGYNEILVGRFNRFVQKHFSMKGPASLNEVSSVLNANINFSSGVENAYLEDWDFYATNAPVGAQGAGLASILRIRNPLTSGVIAVIHKAQVSNGQAAVAGYVLEGSASGPDQVDEANDVTPSGAIRFDTRFGPMSPSSVIRVTFGSAPGSFFVPVWQGILPPFTATGGGICDAILYEHQEIVMLPGTQWQMRCTQLNQGMNAAFWWRVRALEDSEKR